MQVPFIFAWVTPLVRRGWRVRLTLANVRDGAVGDATPKTAELLQRYDAIVGSFEQRMWKMARLRLAGSAILYAVYACTQLAQPLLLRRVIQSVQEGGAEGIWYAVAVGLLVSAGSGCKEQQLMINFRIGVELRALTVALVYRRALAVRDAELPRSVANLFTMDAQKLLEVLPLINLPWATPLQIAVAGGILVTLAGWAALAGVAVLVILIPANVLLVKWLRGARTRHLPIADMRVTRSSEMVKGIRVLKYNGWDTSFEESISALRSKELPYVRTELRVWCLQMTMTIVVPQIATMVALLASVLSQPTLPLTAELAFPILSLFSVIRFPIMYLGEEAGQLAQASIALRRLRGFLTEPAAVPSPPPCAVAPSDVKLVPVAPLLVVAVAEPKARAAAAVEVNGLSVWWKGALEQDPSAKAMASVTAVRGASFRVSEGELLLVAGGVASGKSSLLAGLLGEARTHCHGAPRLPAEGIAFCAQVPWVQNMSLRDNIVFGRPWDAAHFRTVLEACSLRQDLAALPDADHTIIGERGVTLSGGQKQRVALARAAYGLPRVLLLDDVFSALDGPTGRHIFSALFGDAGLLRASAVVLVSHATHFAPSATSILLLHQGEVVANGSLEQLHALAVRPTGLPMEADKRATLTGFLSSVGGGGGGSGSVDTSMGVEDEAMAEAEDAALLTPKQLVLTDAPDHSGGAADLTRPGWQSLRLWLRAAGGCSWLLPELLFFACERASYVGADVWLSAWTTAGVSETQARRTLATVIGLSPVTSARAQSPYLAIYAVFVLSNCAFAYTRTTWFAKGGAAAAARIFDHLLHAVVRSPVVFFDTTPVGRLVARLSYDTEIVDGALVQKGLTVLASLCWLLSGLSVILGVVPAVAAAIGLVAPVFVLTHAAYQRSGVQLQRLYAEAQGPLVSHIEESLAGGATIRAHGCQRRFAQRLSQLNDDASTAYLGFAAVGRWLAFRIETIGAFISFAVATACWAMRDQISAPLSGLAIVWSFNLTVTLNFIVLSTSELENKGVSLERILEYAALPPEAPPRADADDALAPDWPARGAVDFVNVSLRYRPGLPLALNGLTCSIGAGEHVGIVGRTGAGKSTIAAALFRLVEIESGTVRIDGVDLRTLGLHAVRGRALGIVPQEPVLFRGAVRRSLDPLAQHSDEALWAVLETVDMARTVRGLEGELGAESDESGSNFSVGERQLLCFARAMLRAPRLLVLDEATASVDHLADERIQRAIRGAMRSTTLLTVAHRLHTVMDYDRILVLSDGKCAEIGAPHALLQEPASSLSELVDLIGGEVGLQLRDIARRSASTAGAKQE